MKEMRHPNGDMRAKDKSRGGSIETNNEWLCDFLSEMLAVEHGGVELYEKAISQLSHDELSKKLESFLEQTRRHVELCEGMLEAAGAETDYMSPGADAATQKAKGLLAVEVPEEMNDLNNLENLVLAETKDHWNWDMLAAIASKVRNKRLKSAVTKAVREVRSQEREHLKWNTGELTRLAKEMSMLPAAGTRLEAGSEEPGTEAED